MMAITAAQVEALHRRAGFATPADLIRAKASKMRNVKKMIDGITFASSLEARAYQILKLWERAGAIRDLVLQPPFELQPKFRDESGDAVRAIKYLADFSFFDVTRGRVRFVDTKGQSTAMFKLKHKMLKFHYPDADLELWTRQTVKDLSRC